MNTQQLITASVTTKPLVAEQAPPLPQPKVVPKIQDVAKRALLELVIGCVFAGIAACFMVSPLSIGLLFVTVAATVLFNIIVRSIPVYIQSQIDILKKQDPVDKKTLDRIALLEKRLSTSLNVVKVVCPMAFSVVDMNTRSLITHEAGHAITSMALYKNANPNIQLYPHSASGWNPFWMFTGDTSWSTKQLTPLGEMIGRNGSAILTIGAGAGFSVLFGIFALIASHKCKDKHPELSRYFLASAISSIVQQVFYALSALWQTNARSVHDFVQLWASGIHPALAAIALALPLIIRGIIFLYDYLKQRNQKTIFVTS